MISRSLGIQILRRRPKKWHDTLVKEKEESIKVMEEISKSKQKELERSGTEANQDIKRQGSEMVNSISSYIQEYVNYEEQRIQKEAAELSMDVGEAVNEASKAQKE